MYDVNIRINRIITNALTQNMYSTKLYQNVPIIRHLYKAVATWSPLGTTFNSLPAKKLNLLSNESGLFQVEQLTSAEGFYILKETAVNDAEKLVKEATSKQRTRKLVDVFDELSNVLCCAADLSEFIRVAHPEASFRQAAEDSTVAISSVVENLNTNKKLYDHLRNVVENGDIVPTCDVDNHVAKLFLFDFEQSGIHLPEDSRKRIVTLTESIMTLGHYFINGSNKERVINKDTIPSFLHSYFSANTDNIVVSSLQSDCSVEKVREAAYRIYLYPDKQQEYLLQELLKARSELAEICGFQSFGHRALRGTTAETPDFVNIFLDHLNDILKPLVKNDLKILLETKRKDDVNAAEIRPWDISYLTEKLNHDFLQLNSVEVSDFFSLGACMEGLNCLTQHLFGISLRYVEVGKGEVWAQDVYKLAVEHEHGGLLGHIYCDFYRRSGKPQQDCHFTIRGGRMRQDGSYQNPIVVLMLNLNMPRWSGPCLLTPGQLDNLAHEMGHALHSMMARTRHQHVTGTRCATDFAEVPSILMEYFLADHRVLKVFAKHFQTKDNMPDDVVKKLCQSKHLLTATETQTQILYSALDQYLHSPKKSDSTTTEIFTKLQEKYSSLKPVDNTGWPLRFSHLVGYGARYYSYLLSRSVASCIWHKYFNNDPFSRTQGERYRSECLRHGGGKPSRLLLSDYLGQEVRPELMAESLAVDIEGRQKKFHST